MDDIKGTFLSVEGLSESSLKWEKPAYAAAVGEVALGDVTRITAE
jgi:hypothetical protein